MRRSVKMGLAFRLGLPLVAFVLAAAPPQTAFAANTKIDVVAGATDLGSSASYNPAVLPTTTNDVTFSATTSYTNPTGLVVSVGEHLDRDFE